MHVVLLNMILVTSGRDSHTACLQCEQLPVNSLVDRDKGYRRRHF